MIKAQYSEKLEQKLREIQLGEQPERSKKKKSLSRAILFADIIVIIAILIFFSNKMHEKNYETVSVISGGIEYILSLSEQTDKISITLNIINKQDTANSVIFSDHKAGIITILDSSENEIKSFNIAEGVSSIDLSPAESRTYMLNIDNSVFYDYLKRNPGLLSHSQNSVFAFSKSNIILRVLMTINTAPEISTGLKYSLKMR